MSVYALGISVAWIAITHIVFVSDCEAITGQMLADALATSSWRRAA
ncbi:MAG: hypothetical protein JXA09_10715 [Anaerolineae bacterium]|nr:hypothetical protein [Anaerolineae bacterium]